MRAKDIMTKEVITVEKQTKLRDLIKILHQHDITGIPVVDNKGELTGIVSEKDVIRAQIRAMYEVEVYEDIYDLFIPTYSEVETNFTTVTNYRWVEQIMTREVLTVSPDTPVEEIAELMISHRFHRLPVIDKNKNIVGIVTTIDMLKVIKDKSH